MPHKLLSTFAHICSTSVIEHRGGDKQFCHTEAPLPHNMLYTCSTAVLHQPQSRCIAYVEPFCQVAPLPQCALQLLHNSSTPDAAECSAVVEQL